MIEKVDYRTIVEVITVIGWIAFLFVTIRTALRYLVRNSKFGSRADDSLAAAINRDLLKEIARHYQEQTERYHELATKLAVLESRQQGLEAQIKSRRA